MFREFMLTRELLTREREALAGADAVICHNDIVAQGAASTVIELAAFPERTSPFPAKATTANSSIGTPRSSPAASITRS